LVSDVANHGGAQDHGFGIVGRPWIGCECRKGTVWVPFKMIRQKIPGLSSWTLELGGKMKCDQCGKRPERYYPAKQSDAPGFAKSY
jgi:hypothetical protein